jgi:hypothetical protein
MPEEFTFISVGPTVRIISVHRFVPSSLPSGPPTPITETFKMFRIGRKVPRSLFEFTHQVTRKFERTLLWPDLLQDKTKPPAY